jgi:hypothetical protein
MKSKHKVDVTVHKSKSSPGWSQKRSVSSARTVHREAGQIVYVKENGDFVKLPAPGPSNTIVRSGSLLPFPKDTDSQKG